MKKLLLILAAFAALSCSEVEQMKTVTFSVTGVQSGVMTKVASDDVSAVLSASASPFTMSLTLTSKTNPARTYTVNAGASATVAIDSYHVDGFLGGGDALMSLIGGGKAYRYPLMSVSADVEVTDDVDSYSLDASYQCLALIIDYTACSSYDVLSNNGNLSELSGMTRSGDVGIAYLTYGTGWTTNPMRVVANPVDDVNYESKEFRLRTDAGGNPRAEYGKWYCFYPGAVAVTSGSISVSAPGWSEGYNQ